ncbi:hypothetical protein [Acidovorax sp. NCPPB 3576]|uniref:hypothetical protein n=1 Tax=Acidovorax sp. NCPPB 3576 TaxID=2940488 RepID=UPI00234A821E|nr:hypothetical protein [Acidovorax sp. NCPPB 3576]WCM86356.1 hypothetical protein M5C98_13230 [Acidovorax sp. NCPPB 3576]
MRVTSAHGAIQTQQFAWANADAWRHETAPRQQKNPLQKIPAATVAYQQAH